MPDSVSKAAPHERTRRDHSTETAEDYVEVIAEVLREQKACRVTDLARRFGVSHVTVHRIVGRLKREGLVLSERYQPITLTRAGRQLARKCQARHKVVFDFLIALGVNEQTAATDAEGIEHHVSPETLRRFKEFTDSAEEG